MKNIFLNLKRFDIPTSIGGVNNVGYREDYGKTITSFIDNLDGFNFVIFFQESNLLPSLEVANKARIGCQGVQYDDVEQGHNFGAFTTFRTAKSMTAIGVTDTLLFIIGIPYVFCSKFPTLTKSCALL